MAVLMRVLDSIGTVLYEFFPMSRIVLGKAQECVYCLLVVLMALDLNYHLLQPKNYLVAALLRHLITHEVHCPLLMFSKVFLMFFWNILRYTVPQVSSTNANTTCEISATYCVVELILCSSIC